jgi:hypothetical protein
MKIKTILILFSLFVIGSTASAQKYESIQIDSQAYVSQKDTTAEHGIYIETKIPLQKFTDDFLAELFRVQSKIAKKEAEKAAIQKDIDELQSELMLLNQKTEVILKANEDKK